MKNIYLLLSLICLTWGVTCVFGQSDVPGATEVLQCYEASLLYSQSVSMKIDIESDVDADHPNKEYCPYEIHFVFRRNGNRMEWIGQQIIFDDKGEIDMLSSSVIKDIVTGELFARVIGTNLQMASLRAVSISSDCEEPKELLDNPEWGSVLFGRMYGSSHKSIADLLSASTELLLLDKMESINGVSCYVLQAKTKYGLVTVWVAPEKGYSALKWEIHKTSGDFYDEKPLLSNSWLVVFDSVKLQKIDGIDIPVEGRLTHTIESGKRTSVTTNKYKVSEVNLKPDFASLQAFKMDFPDNTRVFVEGAPVGIKYVWKDGKVQPQNVDMTLEEINQQINKLK